MTTMFLSLMTRTVFSQKLTDFFHVRHEVPLVHNGVRIQAVGDDDISRSADMPVPFDESLSVESLRLIGGSASRRWPVGHYSSPCLGLGPDPPHWDVAMKAGVSSDQSDFLASL
jgi:hypothetical protein